MFCNAFKEEFEFLCILKNAASINKLNLFMRKIVFLVMSFFFVEIGIANPIDTIDYWHVYYNGVMISDFSQLGTTRIIILKMDSIRTTDSITVKYFRDTPCFYYSTSLMAKDEKDLTVLTNTDKGTFTPISFYLKDLIEYKKKNQNDIFEIFYFEENRAGKILLFKIRIE